MKTLKDYLTESKKVYSFRIKVAGDLPENFESRLKTLLEKYKVAKFDKVKTTPIQEAPLDFPELQNMSVTIFETDLDYPTTSPQLVNSIVQDLGMRESCIRVRGASEPTEEYQEPKEEGSKEALLNTPYEKGVKAKDYFGNDYNKSFLKDLQKASKERKKELGHKDLKTEAENSGPDFGKDAGTKSPIGSV